jgi:hypothetical protein
MITPVDRNTAKVSFQKLSQTCHLGSMLYTITIFGDVRRFLAMFTDFWRCSPIFGDVRRFSAKNGDLHEKQFIL